jgi:ferredoxin
MNGTIAVTVVLKLVLWLLVIAVATVLLRRRAVTKKLRTAFLVGGILIFGILFGLLATAQFDPNPVDILRNVARLITGQQPQAGQVQQSRMVMAAVFLVVLLGISVLSNKAVCGWICHFGLLQDLVHKVPVPKWKPSLKVTSTVRGIAFVGLVVGLVTAGLDWIGVIDPFRMFRFDFFLAGGIFFAVILVASLFIYRPWCQFVCPFGFLSWVVEQFSLMRPRVNWDQCKKCRQCVKACPTGAMADFYAEKKIHADCFACGACLNACPQPDALKWRKK